MTTTDYFTSARSDAAVDTALSQGFVLPVKPTSPDHPMLPEDLSELDDGAITSLMVKFTAWADYASAQLGMAVVTERECEARLDGNIGSLWKNSLMVDSKLQVTVLRAVQHTDADVIDARKQLEDAYAYRRLMNDLYERYERDAAVLSRELTRRTSNEKPSRRYGL